MGIFDFGKNLVRRAEAADAIQKCLETLERNGMGPLPPDYRLLSSELVAAVWPSLSMGTAGEARAQPQRLSIAAFALARGLVAPGRSERTTTLLAAALGVVLKSLGTDTQATANAVDAALVAQARKAFLDFGARLPDGRQHPRQRRPGEPG